MSTVFIGGLPPEGETLLARYLKQYLPDASMEYLKAAGIKGRIKNFGKSSDVLLIIIEESMYNLCSSVAQEVLELPKVHKYTSVDKLNEFLISKFGRLGDGYIENVEPSPVSVTSIEETRIADIIETENLVVNEPDRNIENELNGIIATKCAIIDNLMNQVKELQLDCCLDDVNKHEAELESLIEGYKASISDLERKVSELEQCSLRESQLKEDILTLQNDLRVSRESVADLQHSLKSANEALESTKIECSELGIRITELTNLCESLKTENGVIKSDKESLQTAASDYDKRITALESEVKESYESGKSSILDDV